MLRTKLFSNHANSPYEIWFQNPRVPKVLEYCIYVIFMLGREGEIPLLKGFHNKWRWEGAVQYELPTMAFKPNERVSVCKHTNQHPEQFVARTVSRWTALWQHTWDLSWTKWQWDRYFSGYFVSLFQYHSITAPSSFIHLSLMIRHRSKLERR